MSGVVTALIADYDIRMFCEQVDDTALSLVSPVYSCNCCKHDECLLVFLYEYKVTILLRAIPKRLIREYSCKDKSKRQCNDNHDC